MPKKTEKEKVISYEESADMMRESRLRGRNDLVNPKGGQAIRIEGPYGARHQAPANEATGDDDNTPSTAAGTAVTGSTNRTQ